MRVLSYGGHYITAFYMGEEEGDPELRELHELRVRREPRLGHAHRHEAATSLGIEGWALYDVGTLDEPGTSSTSSTAVCEGRGDAGRGVVPIWISSLGSSTDMFDWYPLTCADPPRPQASAAITCSRASPRPGDTAGAPQLHHLQDESLQDEITLYKHDDDEDRADRSGTRRKSSLTLILGLVTSPRGRSGLKFPTPEGEGERDLPLKIP